MIRFFSLLACLLLAHTPPEAPRANAETPVQGKIDSSLIDAARKNREIPFRVYSPNGPGPFPLIFLSPGLGENRESYSYLAQSWADAGYLVVVPTHKGTATDDLNSLGYNLIGRAIRAKALTDDESQWPERVDDIRYLLGHLEEIPNLKGKIDKEKVVLAGHSYGAQTSLAGGGAKLKGDPKLAIPEAKLIIAISPQGIGRLGFQQDSWKGIDKPVFYIRGERDTGIFGEPASNRDHGFENSPSDGRKFHAMIKGRHADHYFFIGQEPAKDEVQQARKDVVAMTKAFLDKYLKPGSAQEISTDGITSGRVQFSKK